MRNVRVQLLYSSSPSTRPKYSSSEVEKDILASLGINFVEKANLLARTIMFILILPLVLCSLSLLYADTVSSSELIERAKEFDGKAVAYKGEAVTAILNRGEHSWVNLNDGTNAIGVWSKTSDLGAIKFIGD